MNESRLRFARERVSERGSALVYILIAIALLAALTVAFMDSSGQQTQSQNTYKTVSEIQSQVDFIRSGIQECVLAYPTGDQYTLAPNPVTQVNNPYPLIPNNAYFAACVAKPAAADDLVKRLRCPGNPGDMAPSAAAEACHVDIFSSSTGKFLPPAPPLFSDWHYYAGDDGVFFWTVTTKSDAYIQTALAKLDAAYSVCESDKIDATAGQVDMDSDTPDKAACAAGSVCFRVWMKTKPTAVFPSKAGIPCPPP